MTCLKRPTRIEGGGGVYVGPYSGAGPKRFFGEADKVEIVVEEEKKVLENNSSPGGGNADSISRIKNVKLTVTSARI